jgi:hypothetical protein
LLDIVLLNNKEVLKATDRGMEFLHHCQEIKELLETEDDSRRKPHRKIQLVRLSS